MATWRTLLLILWLGTLAILNAYGYRLPKSVAPEFYELEMITNLGDENNNFNFDGKVWITVHCLESTKKITLHSNELKINSTQITIKRDSDGSAIKVKDSHAETENDFFTINLEEPLEVGKKYKLYIAFEGVLGDKLTGYYRSSYKDKKSGKKKWLAITQFQPISARKALPCFDEPAMKAKFKVSLGRMKKYVGLSNMPLKKTEPMKERDGWEWDRFEESVPMSTYLLALMVSDFGSTKSAKLYGSNITFRIWARKDALDQTMFAGQEGPKLLDFYARYFDIPYPLPKQDMVAIPDFSAGAMENWGLITYRESLLLFDPKSSSAFSEHRMSSIIGHELAHQWFGNLVTMKWWTDTWLNEGFATYMAGLAVHDAHPQWNSLDKEAVVNMMAVFQIDSLQSSHPVSVLIKNPKMIPAIFDAISYKKGSTLLRMMNNFLGKKTFKHGVTKYLLKHKYGNAEQDDLWQSLTDQAHQDNSLPVHLTVKEIMDTWTLQTGYPLVTVIRNYEKKTVDISQTKFLSDKIGKTRSVSKECWKIPLSYITQKDKDCNDGRAKYWTACPMEKSATKVSSCYIEEMPNEDQWVLFNIQATGLYRVNYDQKNWKLLTEQLNSEKYNAIASLNRVQLVVDSMALAWVGTVDYKLPFDILKYLKREKEYLPWSAALSSIEDIDIMLETTSTYPLFKSYMKNILTPIYMTVGSFKSSIKNEDLDFISLQVVITEKSCRYEVANCITEAKKLLQDWMKADKESGATAIHKIPKDIKRIVYCTAIKHGDEKEWMFLWNKFLNSDTSTEKRAILSCLGSSKIVWILNRYLEWSIKQDSGIRAQDAGFVFSSVAVSSVGLDIAKEFLEHNIEKIFKTVSSDSSTLSRLLLFLSKRMNTQEQLNWMNNFLKINAKYFEGAKFMAKQAIETIKINFQWKNKSYERMKEILKQYQQD